MALARIITRSHQCSQELALDLLARGYAVEIVSPENVPDNIADLELRVDTGPGDRLQAKVEAHGGERSASLEFVHYLKAPMGEFIRRPPEPPEHERPVHSATPAISINPKTNIKRVEPLAEVPKRATGLVPPLLETQPASQLHSGPDTKVNVPSMLSPESSSPPPAVPSAYFAVEEAPIVASAVARPTPATQRRGRPAEWLWRVAGASAIVVMLAMVLGFGLRRTGEASAEGSARTPEQTAATGLNLLGARDLQKGAERDPVQAPALPIRPPAAKSEANSKHQLDGSRVEQVKKAANVITNASRASIRSTISRRHSDDLIAPDTVTYLDPRLGERTSQAKPGNHAAGTRPLPRKHGGGVIAANNVTYFDSKSAPKPVK